MKKQSKNVWKILLLTMLLVSTMIITASAATASKVTYKRSIASGKESVLHSLASKQTGMPCTAPM